MRTSAGSEASTHDAVADPEPPMTPRHRGAHALG
jgi:hypothetical protein